MNIIHNIRYTSPTKLSSVQYDRMTPPLDLPTGMSQALGSL
jgi:hypothetical protein